MKINNENRLRKDIWRFLLIAMLIFVLDHLLKYLPKKEKCFLFICFKYTTNTGAAFSLFAHFAWTKFLLVAIALIILVVVGFFYFKFEDKKLLKWALALIFAGTLSNLLDRIILGYVIDVLTLPLKNFPAFNLADVSNLVGVILLIIYLEKK